jgi:hypothetical protein
MFDGLNDFLKKLLANETKRSNGPQDADANPMAAGVTGLGTTQSPEDAGGGSIFGRLKLGPEQQKSLGRDLVAAGRSYMNPATNPLGAPPVPTINAPAAGAAGGSAAGQFRGQTPLPLGAAGLSFQADRPASGAFGSPGGFATAKRRGAFGQLDFGA